MGPGKSWNSFWHFPGWKSHGKRLQVLESPGNLLDSSNNVFRIYVVRNVCRLQGEMILKSWEWKDLRWNLESWEKNLESWKSPANSLKFVPDKGYETLKLKSNAALKSVILFGIKHYETPFY